VSRNQPHIWESTPVGSQEPGAGDREGGRRGVPLSSSAEPPTERSTVCPTERGRPRERCRPCPEAFRSPAAPGGRESRSMSSSSSRATSRIDISASLEIPIFHCPRCRAEVVRRISRTEKNPNHLFYVCSEKGVRIRAISLFCGRDF
jgi:hypothetical protein